MTGIVSFKLHETVPISLMQHAVSVSFLKTTFSFCLGSAANGVEELESLEGNAIAQTVTHIVSTGAEAAEKVLDEEEENEKEGD